MYQHVSTTTEPTLFVQAASRKEITIDPVISTDSLESAADWSKAFNTSILSTSIDSVGLEQNLEALLATPEYEAILLAARSLADKLQVSPEVATEQLIQTFRNIDSCWNKILLKKGAQSLLGL